MSYTSLPTSVGPISVRDPKAVREDVDNLKAALSGVKHVEGFMSAASPGVVSLFFRNDHYKDFETYTRIRYSWTLSADWPRLAMVQALIGQMLYNDPVVYDWAHIQSPTLAFGGAEDVLPGSAKLFQERMKFIVDTIPNAKARLQLLPGLGHVPHLESPEKTLPPLVAFLKEGV